MSDALLCCCVCESTKKPLMHQPWMVHCVTTEASTKLVAKHMCYECEAWIRYWNVDKPTDWVESKLKLAEEMYLKRKNYFLK